MRDGAVGAGETLELVAGHRAVLASPDARTAEIDGGHLPPSTQEWSKLITSSLDEAGA